VTVALLSMTDIVVLGAPQSVATGSLTGAVLSSSSLVDSASHEGAAGAGAVIQAATSEEAAGELAAPPLATISQIFSETSATAVEMINHYYSVYGLP
jgi:phosphotransferase system IIA component